MSSVILSMLRDHSDIALYNKEGTRADVNWNVDNQRWEVLLNGKLMFDTRMAPEAFGALRLLKAEYNIGYDTDLPDKHEKQR